jgi:hypothetical protein
LSYVKVVLTPVALLAALFIVACGGDDGPKRSGVAQVDSVIDAFEEQDRETIQQMLQFTSVPCTEGTDTATRPRCLGEPDGTNVEVFVANECEPGWRRPDSIDRVLDDAMALGPEVYAAFNTPENFYLEGRYAVVFEGNDTRINAEGLKRYLAVGVEADSGLITGMAFGCSIDEPVHFLLPHLNEGFDDWLIEPDD